MIQEGDIKMGIYVNPGNSGFAEIADADYVDKTMLIELINRTVRKRNKFTCVSRPRRFGKSYAAKMLCAYYDRSCDSHELFDDKNIARSESYLTYLNHYNVIYLDITSFVSAALKEIREEQYAPQFYNNEQALRAVIKYAYFAAFGQYVKIEEMPSGKGIADVVFIPASLSRLPAMIIELKWNKTSDGAAAQIRNRKYTASLKPFAGNILLVGINYDEKTGD